ncbi:MAG: DUF1214 domain-containing protein [Chloroflexi bacterium]|nr:DUF1214 domain-containing protein [Chloroflexota bacterium]
MTVYDAETRSLLQNGQPKPSISTHDQPDVNPDGSVDIYFSPGTPEGKEKNWVQTVPGKGHFVWGPPIRPAGAFLRADLETGRHRGSIGL